MVTHRDALGHAGGGSGAKGGLAGVRDVSVVAGGVAGGAGAAECLLVGHGQLQAAGGQEVAAGVDGVANGHLALNDEGVELGGVDVDDQVPAGGDGEVVAVLGGHAGGAADPGGADRPEEGAWRGGRRKGKDLQGT